MKKRILPLILATAMLFAVLLTVSSCSIPGIGTIIPCETCKDDDNDHVCDVCQKVLGECSDTNSDHKCDVCQKVLGECSDTNSDHKCDVCQKVLGECSDTNNDHKCDTCSVSISECADGDDDNLCDVCGTTVEGVEEPDDDQNGDQNDDQGGDSHICADSNSDHICDECDEVASECTDVGNDGFCDVCNGVMDGYNGDGSSLDPETPISFLGVSETADSFEQLVYVFLGQKTRTFYLAFTQIPEKVEVYEDGVYGYNGTFTVKDGFVKDSKYIVPVLFEAPAAQVCRIFLPHVSFTYETATGSKNTITSSFNVRCVPSGEKPNLLGVNLDGSTENFLSTISISTDDVPVFLYFHLDGPICPYGFYGDNISGVGVRIFENNGVYTVRYPLTWATVGTTLLDFEGYYGENLFAKYNDIATVIVTAGAIGEESGGHVCMDESGDGDHRCEFCGSGRTTNCTDTNNNHVCDECGEVKTVCFDTYKDGLCDICGAATYSSDGVGDGSVIESFDYLEYYGAALTDTGKFNTTIFVLEGKTSYTFYVAFSGTPIDPVFTDSAHSGTFTYGQGFEKNDKYIIPVTYTPSGELLCETFSLDLKYTYIRNGTEQRISSFLALNVTKNLETPNFLGASTDGNAANATDSVSITEIKADAGTATIYLYFDGQICPNYIHCNYINAYGLDTSYENGIFTVRVTINYAAEGDHVLDLHTFYGPSLDLYHYYYFIVRVIGETDEPCDECDDWDSDGTCDVCGNPVKGEGGEGDGTETTTPCEKCDDWDSDGICNVCGNPLNGGEGPSCEKCEDIDLDGTCDYCYQPIKNIDALRTPMLIGYSQNVDDIFFESFSTIELSYGKASTIYLKFNTEVEIKSFYFLEQPIERFTLVSSDKSGVIYEVALPAPSCIFDYISTVFFFSTAYSTDCPGQVSFSCMPDTLPVHLGMIENGVLTQDMVTVPSGDYVTLQFALNVEVTDIAIMMNGCELPIIDSSHEFITGEEYYLYTVRLEDTFMSGEYWLELRYTYCGTHMSSYDTFLPTIYLWFYKQDYIVNEVAVNGQLLSSSTDVPHGDGTFEIIAYYNLLPTKAFLRFNGMDFEGTISSERGEYGYAVSFLVTEQSSELYSAEMSFVAYNGEFREMLAGSYYITLSDMTGVEGGSGTEGGEVGKEEGGEESKNIEVLSVFNYETGELVENNTMYVTANGKAYFKITYSVPVSDSYILYNGEYYYGYAHSEEENTYFYDVCLPIQMRSDYSGELMSCTVELYAIVDGTGAFLASYECLQEMGAFYGIYLDTTTVDKTIARPTGVQLSAGSDAIVYLATNVDFYPQQISLITPYGSMETIDFSSASYYENEELGVIFFEIVILGTSLTVPEGEAEGIYKLLFYVDEYINCTYVITVK